MNRLRAGFAVALIALLLFSWLAAEVHAGRTFAFDAAARRWVLRNASPALTFVMRGFSLLGETLSLVAFVALAAICFWRGGRRRAAWLLLVAMAGATLLDQALKFSFGRLRPQPFFDTPMPHSYSFPSGHALTCCALFGMLAALLAARESRPHARILLWTAAALLVAMIGFSRIYLGVHYATDVLGGFAAAVVWIFVVYVTHRQLRRHQARHL